jgi:hypothetical protein
MKLIFGWSVVIQCTGRIEFTSSLSLLGSQARRQQHRDFDSGSRSEPDSRHRRVGSSRAGRGFDTSCRSGSLVSVDARDETVHRVEQWATQARKHQQELIVEKIGKYVATHPADSRSEPMVYRGHATWVGKADNGPPLVHFADTTGRFNQGDQPPHQPALRFRCADPSGCRQADHYILYPER